MKWEGEDRRPLPLVERRKKLAELLKALPDATFSISEEVGAKEREWEALHRLRATARERGVEGLMLKRRDSPYRTGRRRGDWWKWKLEPMTLDCVLTLAQAGSGKRAGLFTDYTFGVWMGEGDERRLVTIAKAYSGLDNEEIAELDAWIRRNTLEKYGPVRAVKPEHVFEIAFEGIRRSKRHKAGMAVRFPRIKRWRRDKTPEDANSTTDALALLDGDDG